MAVTFLMGFDSGDIDAEDATSGFVGTGCSIAVGSARTGGYGLRVAPASGVAAYCQSGYIGTPPWLHFALKITTLPSVARRIFGTEAAGGLNLLLNANGTISVREGTTVVGTSVALSTGTWYWIGLRSGTVSSAVILQIDGNDAVSGSLTTGSCGGVLGCQGTEASAIDLSFDDVIVDNAGFLAPSKVDTLLLVSDDAIQDWLTGAGGQTNLFEAANNVPPAGVASASETDLTNIESPSNSGVANYIGVCETYDSVMAAGDTLLAVQAYCEHGEDISTGAKTGSIEVSANPVVGSVAFTFGTTGGGAHGARTSGLWWTAKTAIAASPSVTRSAGPKIKVRKTDTTTRTGCIDFLGVRIAWTPGATGEQHSGSLTLSTATGLSGFGGSKAAAKEMTLATATGVSGAATTARSGAASPASAVSAAVGAGSKGGRGSAVVGAVTDATATGTQLSARFGSFILSTATAAIAAARKAASGAAPEQSAATGVVTVGRKGAAGGGAASAVTGVTGTATTARAGSASTVAQTGASTGGRKGALAVVATSLATAATATGAAGQALQRFGSFVLSTLTGASTSGRSGRSSAVVVSTATDTSTLGAKQSAGSVAPGLSTGTSATGAKAALGTAASGAATHAVGEATTARAGSLILAALAGVVGSGFANLAARLRGATGPRPPGSTASRPPGSTDVRTRGSSDPR